jgi:hypothetical protein
MLKLMQSGHQARNSWVCQAQECIGDDGHALVLQIPNMQGRVHNQMFSFKRQVDKASMAVTGTEERHGSRRCQCCLLAEVGEVVGKELAMLAMML